MSNDRHFLSAQEAEAMLPEGDYIHTFSQSGYGPLIGIDMSRQWIIELITSGAPELSGPIAMAMKHGIVIFRGSRRTFIETKEASDEQA